MARTIALCIGGFALVALLLAYVLMPPILCQFCEEDEQTGPDGLCDLCRKIKSAIEEEERAASGE